MDGFGGRLRAGMLAAGVFSAAELARRCAVSKQTAATWLSTEGLSLSAAHLVVVCDALRVRLRWLTTGHGHPTPWSPQAVELLKVLEELTPANVALWLRLGHWLAERPQNLTR